MEPSATVGVVVEGEEIMKEGELGQVQRCGRETKKKKFRVTPPPTTVLCHTRSRYTADASHLVFLTLFFSR